ncbi:aminopeptidase, partial [uncultured Veillonella sp.]|uniref:aminopeptidase n=1 Tax=uncultured Veillonella sp. TaxID=159268 RepID=UPI00261024D8
MELQRLQTYAKALLTTGVNLQKEQTLVISVDVENHKFVEVITEEAYKLGAKEVVVNWRSTPISKLRLLHGAQEVLEEPAPWIPTYYKTYVDQKAAFLSLISANPTAMKGVPSDRMATQSRSLNKVLSFYHDAIMDSTLTWCVASVATLRWTELLGFTGTDEEKIDALWTHLFTLCRIEGVDEENTLDKHLARLKARTEALNSHQF